MLKGEKEHPQRVSEGGCGGCPPMCAEGVRKKLKYFWLKNRRQQPQTTELKNEYDIIECDARVRDGDANKVE